MKMTIEQARKKVADDWRENAKSVYDKNLYAGHVTEETKLRCLENSLKFADEIEHGKQDKCFTVAQRIHLEMAGVCGPFLTT